MENLKVPEVTSPTENRHPDGSPIKRGAEATEFWPFEAKALEIAKSRVKGARRACKIVDANGNVRYATATHLHYLMEYILTVELGWGIVELGKEKTVRTLDTAVDVLAAFNMLPEAEREIAKQQFESVFSPKIVRKSLTA